MAVSTRFAPFDDFHLLCDSISAHSGSRVIESCNHTLRLHPGRQQQGPMGSILKLVTTSRLPQKSHKTGLPAQNKPPIDDRGTLQGISGKCLPLRQLVPMQRSGSYRIVMRLREWLICLD